MFVVCVCFRVRGGCGCRILRENFGVGCGYMYVGSCDVYRSCEVGHSSTEFPPSTSFFHPLPHNPFFKRHLLKENCESDTREIACTVSSAVTFISTTRSLRVAKVLTTTVVESVDSHI
jgi:hypothetical protein